MIVRPRLEWAVGVLGIDISADANVVRRAVMEKIRRGSFELTPEIADAASVFGIGLPGRSFHKSSKAAIDAILERRLTDLANRYWDIEPSVRVQIWQSLSNDAEMNPNRKRHMDTLHLALYTILPNPPNDDNVQEIWSLFKKVYPANHIQRDRLITEYYQSFPKARKQFINVDPKLIEPLAAIDAALVERIATAGKLPLVPEYHESKTAMFHPVFRVILALFALLILAASIEAILPNKRNETLFKPYLDSRTSDYNSNIPPNFKKPEVQRPETPPPNRPEFPRR
jgi:hypothetical protein